MISVTSAAIKEVQRLTKQQHDLSGVRVRLGVEAGHCADWAYKFGPDNSSRDGDVEIDCDGFTLLINEADAPFLQGLTIDYCEDLLGGAFRYQNPNATSTCDCGNSFSVAS